MTGFFGKIEIGKGIPTAAGMFLYVTSRELGRWTLTEQS